MYAESQRFEYFALCATRPIANIARAEPHPSFWKSGIFRALILGAIVIGAIGAPSTGHAASRAYTASATAFYVEYITIPTGSSVVFQTTASSTGADPVLHLLRDDGGGAITQVAFSDDYINHDSRISYTNPMNNTSYILILRAYSTSSAPPSRYV